MLTIRSDIWCLVAPPIRINSWDSSTRNSFVCIARGTSSMSSRKILSPFAISNRPFFSEWADCRILSRDQITHSQVNPPAGPRGRPLQMDCLCVRVNDEYNPQKFPCRYQFPIPGERNNRSLYLVHFGDKIQKSLILGNYRNRQLCKHPVVPKFIDRSMV